MVMSNPLIYGKESSMSKNMQASPMQVTHECEAVTPADEDHLSAWADLGLKRWILGVDP